jgi:hypothetical protein
MTKAVTRGLFLAGCLLGLPGPADPVSRPANLDANTDPRLIRIKSYFQDRDCPAHIYAEDFLQAADQNELDWRLLPSLSMVESTGGKEARNNNMFGWDNCDRKFRSTREGIYAVASRLRNSKYYKDKDLDEILRNYNPRPEYAPAVKSVMRELGPLDLAPAGVFSN